MSYSIAYAAFRNVDKTALLEYFRLRDTGEHDLYNESPFSGGDLPSGWYLIWSNDLIWGADEKNLLNYLRMPKSLLELLKKQP